MISTLGHKMTVEYFDNALNKFETIDQSCRAIFEHCQHPSSLNVVAEMTHHLQDVIEKLQLASLTMSQPSSTLEEKLPSSDMVESDRNHHRIAPNPSEWKSDNIL
ncbi:unnamed protein product [Rotaria sp. Silwood1]|nr:unnamed protein product [Rotaria sp. Silwood1]CAF1595355.1 unnamed protein product [Rotaria sp. Silwood1]CAF3654878.1 unnamed protein product [Rotaria sp. Silwood1]CAF3696438.1 unnamed protein product [Rotaria sp. Silwood1]CAF3718156.1 unnamed protein product [Rotaria sp. Silwood1]